MGPGQHGGERAPASGPACPAGPGPGSGWSCPGSAAPPSRRAGPGGSWRARRSPAPAGQPELAVLGQAAFGDVHLGHDLEPGQMAACRALGRLGPWHQGAVHPVAGEHGAFPGLDVQIGGPVPQRLEQELVHQADDGQFCLPGLGAPSAWRRASADDLVQARAVAVGLGRPGLDVLLGGAGHRHRQPVWASTSARASRSKMLAMARRSSAFRARGSTFSRRAMASGTRARTSGARSARQLHAGHPALLGQHRRQGPGGQEPSRTRISPSRAPVRCCSWRASRAGAGDQPASPSSARRAACGPGCCGRARVSGRRSRAWAQFTRTAMLERDRPVVVPGPW